MDVVGREVIEHKIAGFNRQIVQHIVVIDKKPSSSQTNYAKANRHTEARTDVLVINDIIAQSWLSSKLDGIDFK